LKELF